MIGAPWQSLRGITARPAVGRCYGMRRTTNSERTGGQGETSTLHRYARAVRDYVFQGGSAVVTGAASGIGEALSHARADRGSQLALIDRDGDGLEAVTQDLRTNHPRLAVRTYVADLSEIDSLATLTDAVLTDLDTLTLLINNAGVALGGRFDQISMVDFDWVMRVNFVAPVHLTHALLPALKASPGSHLVNVSSVYGLIGPQGQSAYAASKFALRGFTEVLRHELQRAGVGVTVVHPGNVRTKIVENARRGARGWRRRTRSPPTGRQAAHHRPPRRCRDNRGWSPQAQSTCARRYDGQGAGPARPRDAWSLRRRPACPRSVADALTRMAPHPFSSRANRELDGCAGSQRSAATEPEEEQQ